MTRHQHPPRRYSTSAKGHRAGRAALARKLRYEWLEVRRVLATLVVSSLLDTPDTNPGDGVAADASGNATLRAAVMEANALADPDEIHFDAALSGQTILLGGTELTITDALTIDANALAENITIDAQAQSRFFNINDGGMANDLGATRTSRVLASGRIGLGVRC